MQVLTEILGVTIAQDAAKQCLSTTWHGTHNGRQKKICCLTILQKVRETGSVRILSDSSQDLDGWHEIVQWLGNEYYTELQTNGIRALAFVVPHNLKAHTDLNNALATIRTSERPNRKRIEIDTFTDVEAAYLWLQNT